MDEEHVQQRRTPAMSASWLPGNISLDKPSVARMYDYFLGGAHNFAIDRQAADQVVAACLEFPLAMRANRGFLRRAVRYLLAEGVEQFLDVGSGIPTVGNVHEVAQRVNTAARVVYVDMDPVAVAHSKSILQGNAQTAIVEADARYPEQFLRHPDAQRLLDFEQPVSLVLVAMLHFVTKDEEAYGLVQRMLDALPSGSYLVLSHGTTEGVPAEVCSRLEHISRGTSNPMVMRTRAAVERFFGGLLLVEPGVVYTPLWRPEGLDDLLLEQPELSLALVGVARKP
jgi:hypothetical protein